MSTDHSFGVVLLKVMHTKRFNNPDKGAVTHAIVHRALWEYLLAVNDTRDEAERERLRKEIFERSAFDLILLIDACFNSLTAVKRH